MTSIKYLQEYIKQKDYKPELYKDYYLKLAEEVGELSRAIRKQSFYIDSNNIKGTVDEELWDIIYYSLAIANCFDIDVEGVIKLKEEINNKKYNSPTVFEENK